VPEEFTPKTSICCEIAPHAVALARELDVTGMPAPPSNSTPRSSARLEVSISFDIGGSARSRHARWPSSARRVLTERTGSGALGSGRQVEVSATTAATFGQHGP